MTSREALARISAKKFKKNGQAKLMMEIFGEEIATINKDLLVLETFKKALTIDKTIIQNPLSREAAEQLTQWVINNIDKKQVKEWLKKKD